MSEDIGKRIKSLNKKLVQIDALKKKKQSEPDKDVQEKINSEPDLRQQLAELETKLGEEASVASLGDQLSQLKLEPEPGNDDPLKQEREQALELRADDMTRITDSDKKKFRDLHKKLQAIGKLHEKGKESLDKLQLQKLEHEHVLIKEIVEIQAKAVAGADVERKQEPAGNIGGYPASSASAVDLKEIHLCEAITKGLISERRSKYVDPDRWHSTFEGAFRVSPPSKLPAGSKFNKIKTFEYFMWKDVKPQPTFDNLKDTIGRAIGVGRGDFGLATKAGKQLHRESIMLPEFYGLPPSEEVGDRKWKIVDIEVVVKK